MKFQIDDADVGRTKGEEIVEDIKMALPTDIEIQAIQTFRQRVDDILSEEQLSNDLFLLRWLRARDLDLNKAEQMLRTSMKWRQENKVDSLLQKPVESYFIDNFPRYIGSRSKSGHPLYYAEVGKWDTRRLARDGKSHEFFEYTTHGFEKLLDEIKSSEKERKNSSPSPDANENEKQEVPITQIISIFDFEGFAWSQLFNFRAIQEFLSLGSIYEAHYPEILYSSYFINCPYMISKIMLLLSPILAPKTMAKIKIFNSNKEEWMAELKTVFQEDQLIPQLGGTMEVPCRTVPESK